MENNLARKPHFFKVLIGDFKPRLGLDIPDCKAQYQIRVSCRFLLLNKRIPPSFLKQISQESSETAILEGPSGNHWHVKLNKTTNDIYLQDGWEEFSRAHSLREGEFLVFKHCDYMHFKVKIFDKSACEREDAFKVKCSQPANIQGNKRQRPLKSPLEPSHLSHHSKKRKNDCILEQKCPCQGKRGSLIPKPSRTVETRGTKAKEAAYSFTSSFPYFEVQIKVGPPFHVMVPVSFSRLHLPSVSTEVTLLNQEGKIWMVNFHIYSGKHLLDGGWDSFFHANNLKNGDYCVFELVDELEMKVHIFRVSSQMSRNSIRLKEETHEPSMGKSWRIVDTSLCTGPSAVNPYFMVTIGKKNLAECPYVNVPSNFVKEHLTKFKGCMASLEDKYGRIWPVKIPQRRQASRVTFGTGWREFSMGNNLVQGDVCRFELIAKAKQNGKLKFRFTLTQDNFCQV